jgi:uncharacterized membrane protein
MTMTPLSKKLVIALVISGALNLLCLGLFAGGAIRRHQRHDMKERFEHVRGPAPGPRGGADAREGRREGRPDGKPERGPRRGGERPFAKLFSEHPEEMEQHRHAIAEARQAARDALVKEPFEPAALEQSLAKVREQTAVMQADLHRRLVDVARSGTKESREKLGRGFDFAGPPSL